MVINNNITCAYIILDNILFLEFVSIIVYNISVIIYDYDIGRINRIFVFVYLLGWLLVYLNIVNTEEF